MTRAKRAVRLLMAALALPLAVTAAAADVTNLCARCHGADGNSSKPLSPSIAGDPAGYIIAAMKQYRDGERQCKHLPMKCKMVAKWSDEDVAAAAAFFAQSKRVAAKQPFDEALVATGKSIHEDKCAHCHDAGAPAEGEPAPLLNGQWMEDLEYALGEYASGGRKQPDEMRSAVESLDDNQLKAVLNYYASGQ